MPPKSVEPQSLYRSRIARQMSSAVEYLIDVAKKANFARLVILLKDVRTELNASGANPAKSDRRRRQAEKLPSARRSSTS